MLITIDNRSGVPIYRQVLDQIRKLILTGQLCAGDQLDSVRELAGRLRVNPMTVSKAYQLLEIEGLAERRRGVGLFVRPLQDADLTESRLELLREVLKKAAVSAVQLGVSKKKAVEILEQYYEQTRTK